jgi:uncharacterized integral membrane protein
MSEEPQATATPDGAADDSAEAARGGRTPARRESDAATRARRTRTGMTWTALAVAALLLVILLIFIAENTASVKISFLGADLHAPLGVALLVAAVAGALLTVLVGSARIIQLRLALRRARRQTSGPPS